MYGRRTHKHTQTQIVRYKHTHTQAYNVLTPLLYLHYTICLYFFIPVCLSRTPSVLHTHSLSRPVCACVFWWCRQNRQNVATTTGYGLNNGNANGFTLLNLDSSLAVNKKSQVTNSICHCLFPRSHMIVES